LLEGVLLKHRDVLMLKFIRQLH